MKVEETDNVSTPAANSSSKMSTQVIEEPFFSLLQRCDKAIASLDQTPFPLSRPQLAELLASASDEMALRLEKQAKRLREETVSKYDNVIQTAISIKAQRSNVRKIDINCEMNAKRFVYYSLLNQLYIVVHF